MEQLNLELLEQIAFSLDRYTLLGFARVSKRFHASSLRSLYGRILCEGGDREYYNKYFGPGFYTGNIILQDRLGASIRLGRQFPIKHFTVVNKKRGRFEPYITAKLVALMAPTLQILRIHGSDICHKGAPSIPLMPLLKTLALEQIIKLDLVAICTRFPVPASLGQPITPSNLPFGLAGFTSDCRLGARSAMSASRT